jgi:hypothetical protein
LGPQREEPVRRLIKIRVEVPLSVFVRRTVGAEIGHLPAGGDLPRRRIEQRYPHAFKAV